MSNADRITIDRTDVRHIEDGNRIEFLLSRLVADHIKALATTFEVPVPTVVMAAMNALVFVGDRDMVEFCKKLGLSPAETAEKRIEYALLLRDAAKEITELGPIKHVKEGCGDPECKGCANNVAAYKAANESTTTEE